MDDGVGRYTYPGRIFPVSRSASRSDDDDDNRRRPAYSPRYSVDSASRICRTISPLINHDFPVNSRKNTKNTRKCVFFAFGGGRGSPSHQSYRFATGRGGMMPYYGINYDGNIL